LIGLNIALDAVDGIDAKPFDERVGVVTGNSLVRHIGDGNARKKNRYRQKHKQRHDARPQPQLPRKQAFHRQGEPWCDSGCVERRPTLAGTTCVTIQLSRFSGRCAMFHLLPFSGNQISMKGLKPEFARSFDPWLYGTITAK